MKLKIDITRDIGLGFEVCEEVTGFFGRKRWVELRSFRTIEEAHAYVMEALQLPLEYSN